METNKLKITQLKFTQRSGTLCFKMPGQETENLGGGGSSYGSDGSSSGGLSRRKRRECREVQRNNSNKNSAPQTYHHHLDILQKTSDMQRIIKWKE